MWTYIFYIVIIILLAIGLGVISYAKYEIDNTDLTKTGCNQNIINSIQSLSQILLYLIIGLSILIALLIGIGIYNITAKPSRRYYYY